MPSSMKKWLGVGLTVTAIVAALAAPWLAPHDPLRTDFPQSLRPPGTAGHLLGTDQLGRDLLARVLHGARLALFIGVCTVVLTAIFGGLLGLVAGFVERWPSAVLMRIADVQLSFPFILLAMTINTIVGLGLRNTILSLSAAGWVVYARVVRGEVLSVKQRDYVLAAARGVHGHQPLLRVPVAHEVHSPLGTHAQHVPGKHPGAQPAGGPDRPRTGDHPQPALRR